jgi:hypothetical protein
MDGGAMESPVVAMLNIGNTIIPCTWMLRVVHVQDVQNHLIDDVFLAVSLGVESSGLLSLVSNNDQRLDQNVLRNLLSRSEMRVCGIPKWTHTCSKKRWVVSVACNSLLAGYEDGHVRKPINYHKYTIISLFGGLKAINVIYRNGFPRNTRSRKRGV